MEDRKAYIAIGIASVDGDFRVVAIGSGETPGDALSQIDLDACDDVFVEAVKWSVK